MKLEPVMPIFASAMVALLLTGCVSVGRKGEQDMETKASPGAEKAILAVIDNYVRAGELGDPGLWESLFWLDDPDFTVIENDRPHLMGREYIDFITGLIRERGKGSAGPKWYKTNVNILSPDIAYTTSLRDEVFPSGIEKASRITLVFKKKEGQWRIIHGHFSVVPDE